MQLFVRSYAGEPLAVEVPATSTVLELKQHLEARLGTPLDAPAILAGLMESVHTNFRI